MIYFARRILTVKIQKCLEGGENHVSRRADKLYVVPLDFFFAPVVLCENFMGHNFIFLTFSRESSIKNLNFVTGYKLTA